MVKTFRKLKKIIRRKAFLRAYFVALLIIYLWPWLFPYHVAYARSDISIEEQRPVETVLKSALPPDTTLTLTVTGYSSTPEETDSTPFTTANGTRVRWGIVATNLLPFNSRVRVKGEFGDEIFIVTDRMHPRFSHRLDIWFPTREEALAFGKQRLEVEVWYY